MYNIYYFSELKLVYHHFEGSISVDEAVAIKENYIKNIKDKDFDVVIFDGSKVSDTDIDIDAAFKIAENLSLNPDIKRCFVSNDEVISSKMNLLVAVANLDRSKTFFCKDLFDALYQLNIDYNQFFELLEKENGL